MLHLSKLKIMDVFFENPSRNYHLREISRITNIAVTSVKQHLKELMDDGLVTLDLSTVYPSYKANENAKAYRIYKQQAMLLKIHHSGLLNYLEKEMLPKCIILFGSARKGEYDRSSDIDIFIQAPEKKLHLAKFEKVLRHKVSILFEPKIEYLSKELLNNIANGIVLYGYLKIR